MTNTTSLTTQLTWFGIALVFILSFCIDRGYNAGAVFLFLLSLTTFRRNVSMPLPKASKKWIYLFLMYIVCEVIINLWHKESGSRYDHVTKLLLAIPIFLHFLRYPISSVALFFIIAVAAVIGGLVGTYDFFINHNIRATAANLNPIHYASIIQLLGFISLIGLTTRGSVSRPVFRLTYTMLLFSAVLFSLVASVFSGSRGAWVAFPFQLTIVMIFYFKKNKKETLFMLLGLAALLSIIYCIPHTGIKQRVHYAVNGVTQYQNDKPETSTGIRLEMWKMAGILIPQHPITGYTTKELEKKRKQLVEENKIDRVTESIVHFHNHFIEKTLRYGLIGLITLLSLYFFSAIFFIKQLKHDQGQYSREYAYCGLLLLVSYFIYNMTDLLLNFNFGVLNFVILLSIFWAGSITEPSCKQKA